MEVKPFGIDVVIIEPGGIKTAWGMIAADHLEDSAKGGPYEEMAVKEAQRIRNLYQSRWVSDSKVVANTILKAVNASRAKTRYLVGSGARTLVFLHAVLPNRLFDNVIKYFL